MGPTEDRSFPLVPPRLETVLRIAEQVPKLAIARLTATPLVPSPSFAIIIPIHNEAGFVGPALEQIVAQVDLVTPDYRIILVENGSIDGTATEANQLAAQDARVNVPPIAGSQLRPGDAPRHGIGWRSRLARHL